MLPSKNQTGNDANIDHSDSISRVVPSMRAWLQTSPVVESCISKAVQNSRVLEASDHPNDGNNALAKAQNTPRKITFAPLSHVSDDQVSNWSWSVSIIELAKSSAKDNDSRLENLPGDDPFPRGVLQTTTNMWANNIPNLAPVTAIHTEPLAHQCDIDTYTGKLLAPVKQEETLRNGPSGPCRDLRDIAWRYENMTSGLRIYHEIEYREKAKRVAKQAEQQIISKPLRIEEQWPNADCIIRPAAPPDFEQIVIILNREVDIEPSPQAHKKITVSEVRKIYQQCQASCQPFVVSTPLSDQSLFDPSKWPPGSERIFEEFKEFKKFKNAQAPSAHGPAITGFAFVDEARLGFDGSQCPGNRHIGQIRLVVHPDHRQKKYGSALLDRILCSVAPLHRSLIDYEWHCDDPKLIYESLCSINARQYAWVFMEMFSTGSNDSEYVWKSKMLHKFQFCQVAHLEKAAKTNRNRRSHWLDLSLWRLEAQAVSQVVDVSWNQN